MSHSQNTSSDKTYNLLAPIFLMCQPDYYDPRVEAHKKPDGTLPNKFFSESSFDKERAFTQWNGLKTTLENLGARIILTPPVEGLIDQVYTTDSSVSLMSVPSNDQKFSHPVIHTLVSRFRHSARAGEAEAQEQTLTAFEQDIKKAHLNGSCPDFMKGSALIPFEGGDNLYDPFRDVFWSGYGDSGELDSGRSDRGAHMFLREVMNVTVRSIEVAGGFYHLDTSLAPLPGGHVLCYPGGMSPQSFAYLEQSVGPENLIIADEEDASAFACNVIVFDQKNIIMPECSDALAVNLEDQGYRVHQVDVSEFMISGGGPHCLTNHINKLRIPGGLSRNPDFFAQHQPALSGIG